MVSIKPSEFRNIESLVRGSLSVLSYIQHFDVAPAAQMLLNRKLSGVRAILHLANVNAKVFGNLVLARRDSFLARSKVAGDKQLKNYLRTTSMTHSSLFGGQLTPVAKELSEGKRRQQVPSNRRTSISTITALHQDHSTQARAQPAKPGAGTSLSQPLPLHR